MSEHNVSTADRTELEAMAADLGVKYRADAKDDTLRAKIKEALGEPEPDTAAATSDSAPGEASKPRRFRIIIATHDQDKQPVPVGVNGRNYVIERGKEVVVPESVLHVLNNAVQSQYDPKSMEETKVMAYPYQNLGEVE